MAPTTPLFDPDAYFAREGVPSLKTATAVAAGFCLVMVAYLSLITWYLFDYAAELPDVSIVGLLPVTTMIMGLTVLLVWALQTTLLHGIARLVDGTGSLTSTIAIAAWGFVPYAGIVLIQAATTPFTLPDEPIAAEDPTVVAEQLAADAPLAVTLVSLAALAAGILWAIYIWTYGIARIHDVSTRRAAIGPIITAVFVPLVLGVF